MTCTKYLKTYTTRLCLTAMTSYLPLGLAAVALQSSAPSLHAAEKATGTIEGRVMNGSNGNYLSKAIVTVQGTTIETLTSDTGDYQLRNVPAGAVTLVVTFTGQPKTTAAVAVAAGKTSQCDISMVSSGTKVNEDGSIVMDTFVVEAARFRSAQEIAANEEFNSTNIKSVVAADSLGYIPDGNVAEFVKFLPGIEIEYGGTYVSGDDAAGVGVRGFGSEFTQVMIDGVPVSSASPASLTRSIGMDMLSLNNASRVEIIKVSTPDMDSDSPGGAINLITRSAFEYAKPQIDIDLTFTGNTMERDIFKKSPGPGTASTFHTLPGIRASVSMKLTKTLGISASLSSDNKYGPNESYAATWLRVNRTDNLTPLGLGSATQEVNARGRVDLSNPYLQRASITEQPWNTFRKSANLKVDWRPIKGLNITSNLQYSSYTGITVARRAQFTMGAVQDWGADYVTGYANKTTSPTYSPGHSAQMTMTARDKEGDTRAGYFKFDFKKGPIKLDGTASRSQSYGHFEDFKNGHFSGLDLKINTGKLAYEGIHEGIPSTIRVWNTAGVEVDPGKLSSWVFDSSTIDAQSGEAFQKDIAEKYLLNARYELDFMPFPLAFKTGFSRNVKYAGKWGRGTGYKMRYVGPTLTPGQILDTYTSKPMYGLPSAMEWASVYKFYQIYEENPEYFNPDAIVDLSIGNYNSMISQTKAVRETADSKYAMLDGKLFKNRVDFIVGARQKMNRVVGTQPYVESKFNYVRLPSGLVYTDSIYNVGVKYDGSTGKKFDNTNYAADAILSDSALIARMQAAGAIIPTRIEYSQRTTDAVNTVGSASNNLTLAKERFKHRSINKTRKDDPTPQVQVALSITPQLKIKAAWDRSFKLPDLENTAGGNGGLLTSGNSLTINPSLSVFNGDEEDEPDGFDGTINLSNPGLAPETTDSWNFDVSYKSKSGGKLSVGYYIKTTKNRWEEVDIYRDDPAYDEILTSFGLNPENYSNYKLTTKSNGSATSTSTGYEASLNQNLGFIGGWAKRFDIFATYTHRPNAASTVPSNPPLGWIATLPTRDKYTGGVSFSTQRLTIQARATFRQSGLSRSTTIAYTEPGATSPKSYQVYNVIPRDARLNLQMSYRMTKRYSTFLSANNVLQSRTYRRVADTFTGIMPTSGHFTAHAHRGVGITVGLSGTF